MPLVSKSFSIDIVPGKTPPTVHVSEKDIGRLYYISIVDDGTPFSIPSGTTAKVEGTIGPYGFSENANVINNTVIVTLRSSMTAIKGKVWTKIKLTNNGDIASTCAFWLNVDKAGAVEGQYIDPGTIPDPGGDGGLSLEGFVQYNEPQALSESEKAQARANIGAAAVGEGGGGDGSFPYITPEDYGAVGDGATDDTDAVQHALAESITSGKTLFLENKYLVTETLLPNSYYSQTSATVNIIGASPMKRDEFDASKLGGGTILFEHGENGLYLFDGSDGGLTLRGTIHGVKFAPTARAQKSAIFYRCILRGFVFESCFVLNVLAFMHNSSCRAITKIRNSTFLTCYFFSKEDSDTAHDFTDSTIEGCYINGGSEMTENHCFEWKGYNGSNITGNFIDFYRTIYAPWCGRNNGELYRQAFQGPISANNQYQVFRYLYDPKYTASFQFQSDSDCFNWTAPSSLAKLQNYTPLTYTGHDGETHEMPPFVLGVFETGKIEINNAIFQSNIGNIVFVRAAAVNYEYAKAKLTCNINDNFYAYDTYVAMADAIWEKGSYRLNLIDIPFVKNVESLPSIDVPGGWNSMAYPGMRVRNNGHVYRYRWVRENNSWVAKWVDEVPESTEGFIRFVTPEQFGAVGDGVTDDTKAIQAAFDAAANGGTVKFGHKKTYLVTKESGGLMWVSGATKPSRGHYMLKISGGITILGNGSTIIEPPITQEVYDAEYAIKYNPDLSQSASMIFLDNAECRSGSAADNSADFNDRNYVVIRGLVLDGNCHVDRNLDHGGGAGAWWKAINASGARGLYLELNSVTIRNFAAEGVHAMYSPGSKFRAFGCTFENCTPSAWNVGGSLAEAIGCTFNCTDPTSIASEYVSQKTIFDSCTFTSETMRPVLAQTTSGQELIVRNSVFNISATRKGIATIYYVYYDDGFVAEKYFQPGTVYLFSRSSGNTFSLATELQDGQDFLIVNVDDGSGYALAKNTDGSLKSIAVTVSSDSITLSDASAVWVCSTNTNGFVLKNYEKTIVPSDSEDEGGEHQGDELDAYLTCNATYGLLTSSNFATTRWWNYEDNQLKLRITPPQENSIVYAKTSKNMCFDSCIFNDERASNQPEAVLTTKSWAVGKVSNCTFNRTTMGADSFFNVLFVGQAQNNIVRVTNYPTYPDGASIIGRGLSIRLTGRSKYKFNMISAPRTFTIVPSENCTLVAWGFGTRVINVNVPVYARARAQFNVDYSSLPSAPYYNKDLSALRNFFVECDKPFNIIIET